MCTVVVREDGADVPFHLPQSGSPLSDGADASSACASSRGFLATAISWGSVRETLHIQGLSCL
jgi:hypothetical protein